ncbi:MAG TPA: aldo/keto reductase [Chthonomonadaceae bacterium]|nr:aldo/keto reductase [Chthonomonadaceae bacterium]
MNYRKLGRSGLRVSEICLGSWINFGKRIEEEQAFAVLDTALEVGIDFFDTANVYSGGKAEEVIGRWMQGKDRRTLTIATKCRGRMWPGVSGEGLSRKHIMDACHDSLRRLQTDYIDLYQCHYPDPETPLEETMRTLDDLVKQGKVRYIGCSNFYSELIGEAARLSEQFNLNRFISLQPYYNMLERGIEEREVPRCIKERLGMIPYSPLAQGLLSEKYLEGTVPSGSRGEGNQQLEESLNKHLPTLQALGAFAHAREITLSQLALAWLLHRPGVTSPIIGARTPEQVRENAKASEIKLSAGDLAELDTLLKSAAKP